MDEADPRWARSRESLIEAVSHYLDTGATPTITEITARAGVSRPTFYQHFGELPTAYAAAAVERVRAQFARISVPADPADADETFLLETLTELCSHLLAHRDFYTTSIRAGGDALSECLVEFLRVRLTTASPFAAQLRGEDEDEAARDRVTAMAAGIVWLIQHWLVEPEPRSAPLMARRILRGITTFLGAGPSPVSPTI